MIKLAKEGYEYRGFKLGQEVIVEGKKCKIIAFDFEDKNFFIAVNKYFDITYAFNNKNISDVEILNGVYIPCACNEYSWVSVDMINSNVVAEIPPNTNSNSMVYSEKEFKKGDKVKISDKNSILYSDNLENNYVISEVFTSKFVAIRREDGKDMYILTDSLEHVEEELTLPECQFKEGQKVWEFSRGWGTIKRVHNNAKCYYPVEVSFNNNEEEEYVYYTKDGKRYVKFNRVLFFEEIPIPESALIHKNDELK